MEGGAPPTDRQPRPAAAPKHRPSWMVLLSSLMLIYGGLLLVWGLTALRDPQSIARPPAVEPLSTADQAFAQQLTAVNARVITAHGPTVRALGSASLALALLMLYAASATLSRDRRGRGAAIAAGWTGIVYQVATLPLVLPLAREYAMASAPLLAQKVAAEQGSAGPPAESVTALAQTFLVSMPVALSLLGITGSVILLIYFGGRRGRVLYGIEPAQVRGKR
jgi:hypothetical protein